MSGTNTLAGSLTVSNTLTVASSTTLSFGTGSARTLTLSGTGANTLSNSGTIDMSSGGLAHQLNIAAGSIASFGTLTNGSNSAVEYNAAGAQTVNAVSYNHLLISGSGAKALQATPMAIAGNFSISGTAAATAGEALTVDGAFTIGSGTTFSAGSFNHTIKGNFSNSGTFTPSTSTVIMNGSAAQTIGGSNPTTFNSLTVNNTTASLPSATVTLNNAVTVNGALSLTRGYIVSTASNILNMVAGSSTSGTSASSYVNGPMTKTGTTSFVFPIGYGNGTKWERIGIGAPSASTTFRAQYFGIPYSNTTSMASSPIPVLVRVSSKEYWQLDRTAGAGDATVTLYWEDASWSAISDCSDTNIRVGHWNGSAWENNNDAVTVTGSCSGTSAGTLTTSTQVTSFSPFTFGVKSVPLPIELIAFTAECDNRDVRLAWSTASETNNDYFTLERSTDGFDWQVVKKINGAGNSLERNDYSITDLNPYKGTSYYRLKQTDFDGRYQYTKQVAVADCRKDAHGLNIYPNPSSGVFHLATNVDAESIKSIEVFDAVGKRVCSFDGYQADLDLSGLPEGVYSVHITSASKVMVERIVRSN